ncbi:MAG: molybdopterin-synthase adenylyltransferase MoeB [Pseudomonadota bacterium]
MAKLTDSEIARYQRHLVLREVGGAGQQRLKDARVLLIGAGGLGSPLAMYLAAAGVGTLGIVDDDVVSLSNLQRQVLHTTARVGEPKVQSAAAMVGALNPHVDVEAHATRIDAHNALDLIGRYDIVADGSDNFATRYLVSDACHLARRPLVFAAVGPFDGYVSTFKPFKRDAGGKPLPTYRCLFPSAPSAETTFNCAEVGVLGSIVGVVGTLQATEVIKEILGIGDSLAGRLLIYDALSTRFQTMTVPWDPANPLSGDAPTITDLSHHEAAATAEG